MRNDNTKRSSLLDGPDGEVYTDNNETSSEEALDGGLSDLFAPAEPSEVAERPRNISKRARDIEEAAPPRKARIRREYKRIEEEPEEEIEEEAEEPSEDDIKPNPMSYQSGGYTIPRPQEERRLRRMTGRKGETVDPADEDERKTKPQKMKRSPATLDSEADSKSCPFCGGALNGSTKFCPECGESLLPKKKFRSIDGKNEYTYNALAKPEGKYSVFKQLMIAIYSPKGGVGKSSIAKELMIAFGSAKINDRQLKVLLVDTDWENGDIATFCNIPNRPNAVDWVRKMVDDFEEYGEYSLYEPQEIVNNYVIHYSPNIDIIPGADSSMDTSFVKEEHVKCMLENLRHCDYDVILVDCANSVMPRTIESLMLADGVVLVETMDTATVIEATSFLEKMREMQFDTKKIRMVLNDVPINDREHDIAPGDIERTLQIPFVAKIPSTPNLRMANNRAESLFDGKETDYTKEIKKLANSFYPIFEDKKEGFFQKLFGRKK